jgi:hypothetical protein
MFKFSRAVCVFTVPSIKEAVISAFIGAFSDQPPYLIRLKSIDGTILGKLLESRWNGANSHPFDVSGVQCAFKQPVPIGKALYILSELLSVRAHERKDSPPWPGNPALRFTQENLLWGIDFFSRSWRQT